MEKEFEALKKIGNLHSIAKGCAISYTAEYKVIKQALQRLNKYEQILSSGRLTDRNYKNTTLDLESCKPYLRLGQLEDIYEKNKKGK